MKGFKQFLMQGNLIELAVAFVIGAAFATLVKDFVSAIVTPVLNAFSSGSGSQGLGFKLKSGQANTFIDLSAIINSVIVFVLTALVVYLLFVLPYKKYQAMRGKDAFAEGPSQTDLLVEIRDELRARR
ncbi:MscL family protein [Flexivirga sp. ID2601S]|uniref:MscL family protein n=1 Tax=Flexivirga aerilata TaxID=1656889 RepID=A0A849ADD0_9MICO|nr:MscL family protein [Flexivirga aerilata]NNG37753.1 MscL family protein [Flexivirga aerilata]